VNNEATSPQNKPLILIVEDDRFLSKMYAQKFKIEGFEVIIAQDGEQGLKYISEQNPQAVLLDMILPKYSGGQLLEKLKEMQKNVVIIALTNLANQEDAQRAIAMGVKEYLVKAMHTPEEVVNIVKKHLAG